MKILNLTIGAIFTWFGAAKVSSDNSAVIGWVLLAAGIITILSAFTSSNGTDSSGGTGTGWGDSGGGDCGGGGD